MVTQWQHAVLLFLQKYAVDNFVYALSVGKANPKHVTRFLGCIVFLYVLKGSLYQRFLKASFEGLKPCTDLFIIVVFFMLSLANVLFVDYIVLALYISITC